MLSLGYYDLVARFEGVAGGPHSPTALRCIANRRCYDIDSLSGVASKNDLVDLRANKFRHPVAGSFERVGGFLCQLVRPAVHRGIALFIEVDLGVNNDLRFLRCGSGI